MKKYLLLFGILTPLLFVGFLGFQTRWQSLNETATQKVQSHYLADLITFLQKIEETEQLAKELYDFEEVEQMQLVFLQARDAYKRAEFLAAYADEEYILRFINGAPLPKIDPQTADETVVLAPKGLQVLDELIFAPNAESLQPEILAKLAELKKNVKRFHQFEAVAPVFQERQVFEAARLGLIRVMTLGITGFDTPGSSAGIRDSRESMISIRRAFRAFEMQMIEVDPDLYFEIDQQLSNAISHLQRSPRFETFDHTYFIRAFLNPLYSKFKQAHLSLKYQTIYDVADYKQSLNYFADDIFSDDFLNPNYFVSHEADETVYPERRALGKLLFFDPVLSRTKTMACASCHQPKKAFTDGQARSLASDGVSTVERNAPTVINALYAEKFFHDLRSHKLNHQVEHVIASEKEFHTSYSEIFKTLNQSAEYVSLFQSAFPEHRSPINAHTFQTALASYVRSLRSFNSPFDQYMRGERDDIEPAVKRGFNIFMGKGACGTCHFAPTFNGTVPPRFKESESEVLGVPADPTHPRPVIDPDLGRFANKKLKEKVDFNQYAFKTPTVRNVALTAPYMHNGMYEDLASVMDFYNKGGGAGLGINLDNQTLAPDPLGLAEQEIQDVITFMEALTDTTGMTHSPARLPVFPDSLGWNSRPIGGHY